MAEAVFDWYAWVILPVVIFIARIIDVTLGTIRIIFVSRGLKKYAPILGFFEVLIWIVVVGQLVQHLHSVTSYIGYAAGFAVGNFVGMWIENKIAVGTYVLRIICTADGPNLAQQIHDAGFGVTRVDAQGSAGPVFLLYTVVKRRDLKTIQNIIHQHAPKAFVTIEDVRSSEMGFFPVEKNPQTQFFQGKKSK